MRLRNWLIEPRIRSLDPDSPEMTLAHHQVVRDKAMLRQLFEGFYRQCREMDLRYFDHCPGGRVEIGSGAGFIKEIYPDVMTTDTKVLPFVDAVLRAEHMPFPDKSLRAIFAINVFHHLPDPRAFFAEAMRVIHPGGGIVFIEPYHGPVARRVFKSLHEYERFDPLVPDWEQDAAMGPAAGANQAQSYIVFKRDRTKFTQEFSGLELLLDKPHTQLLYLISGGVNFRQLAPDGFAPLVKAAELILAPLNRWIALQHTIVLRKR